MCLVFHKVKLLIYYLNNIPYSFIFTTVKLGGTHMYPMTFCDSHKVNAILLVVSTSKSSNSLVVISMSPQPPISMPTFYYYLRFPF